MANDNLGIKIPVEAEAKTKGFDDATKTIEETGKAAEQTAIKLAKLSNVYSQMASSWRMMKNPNINSTKGWSEMVSQLQALEGKSAVTQEELDRLKISSAKVSLELAKMPDSVKKASASIKEVGKSSKHSTSWLNKFRKNIGRIIMYRLIRAAMSGVAKSFKEGADNLYEYSRALEGLDSLNAKKVLDNYATMGQTIKNTLGVTAVSVIKALEPTIQSLSTKFVELANNINAVVSALMGNNTYTVANADAMKEYAEATTKAKNSLQGFDELNNISTSSGVGKDAEKYKEMFKEMEIPKWVGEYVSKFDEMKTKLTEIVEKIKTLTADIKIKISNLDLDPSGLPDNIVENKMAYLMNTISGALIFWSLGGFKGALLGATLGFGITAWAKYFAPKNEGLTANGILSKLVGILPYVVSGIEGATLGWKIGGVKGAAIGLTIGLSLAFVINHIDWFKDLAQKFNAQLGIGPKSYIHVPDVSGTFTAQEGNLLSQWLVSGLTGNEYSYSLSDMKESLSEALERQSGTIPKGTFSDYLQKINSFLGLAPFGLSSNSFYANGGFPSAGSMFVAGESGAEFVGNFGGRTGVASGQEVTGIREAIYEVGTEILSAMGNTVIEGDMGSFLRVVRKDESIYNRRVGRA